jgi:riboflavin kinase / FMN adenylyltransferase
VEVVREFESLPPATGPAVVTVGFFDGVHLGHQAVIGRTVALARERGLPSVAVTFDRHPREVFAPGTEPRQLTSPARKAELIAALGVDTLLVLEFTEEFSRIPRDEFAKRILVDALRARHVVVGANVTFGYRALGDVAALAELGGTLGFEAEGVPLLEVDGRTVSSTAIRQALADGDVVWPRAALGRRYSVNGRVGEGAGRGATLGWPTANLDLPPKMLLPGTGVYAGKAELASGRWTAASNVGTNPTFGVEPLHLEAFLLDFDGDIRGEEMSIEFWARVSGEERFDSIEALTEKIADDVRRTREIVAVEEMGDTGDPS